jgi:hypothetical protein
MGTFREIERAKDRLEPCAYEFADFSRCHDHQVLEVGCGMGTDTVSYDRRGGGPLADLLPRLGWNQLILARAA